MLQAYDSSSEEEDVCVDDVSSNTDSCKAFCTVGGHALENLINSHPKIRNCHLIKTGLYHNGDHCKLVPYYTELERPAISYLKKNVTVKQKAWRYSDQVIVM